MTWEFSGKRIHVGGFSFELTAKPNNVAIKVFAHLSRNMQLEKMEDKVKSDGASTSSGEPADTSCDPNP